MPRRIRLTEHHRGYIDEIILVLIGVFGVSIAILLIADLCGIYAVWWTDALLIIASISLIALLWISDRIR